MSILSRLKNIESLRLKKKEIFLDGKIVEKLILANNYLNVIKNIRRYSKDTQQHWYFEINNALNNALRFMNEDIRVLNMRVKLDNFYGVKSQIEENLKQYDGNSAFSKSVGYTGTDILKRRSIEVEKISPVFEQAFHAYLNSMKKYLNLDKNTGGKIMMGDLLLLKGLISDLINFFKNDNRITRGEIRDSEVVLNETKKQFEKTNGIKHTLKTEAV
tara:strand:+ start:217 stop:864 length:648 start_codon:yes stop_codon:yes gene_type:complete